MGSSESNKVFDRQAALARVGRDEKLFQAVVSLFLEEAPTMVRQLRRAAGSGDDDDLRRTVHWLKSGLAYIHAEEALEVAESVTRVAEPRLRSARVSLFEESLGRLCRTLRHEFKRPRSRRFSVSSPA